MGLFHGDVMNERADIVTDLAEDLMDHVMFMAEEGVDPDDILDAVASVLMTLAAWRDEASAESADLMHKIALSRGRQH